MTPPVTAPAPPRRTRPGSRAVWLAAVAVVVVVSLVTGCSAASGSAGALPDPPAGVSAPEEYAFGDDVAARDLDAWGPVYDALVEDVDEERLRALPLVLDADADEAVVRDTYENELVGSRKWDTMSLHPIADGAWSQGWVSPDGRDALVLVGLEPEPGENRVPLTVLTTLPDKTSD